jgi:formylmethanofuran dehydrogenase subunit B
MTQESKPNPEPKEEGFLDKLKKLADKAEDFIEDTADKVKESSTYKKAGEMLDKAEDFVEDKAKDLMAEAKAAGINLAEKAGDLADNLAQKLKESPKNEDKTPPAPATPPEEPKV